jgi:putative ABC transport system permease protein
MDIGSLLTSFGGGDNRGDGERPQREPDRVYAVNFMARMMNTMLSSAKTNDLEAFKAYLDEHDDEIRQYVTAIEYSYDVPLNLYALNDAVGLSQVTPSQVFNKLGMMGEFQSSSSLVSSKMTNYEMWKPLIPNSEFLADQYDVALGRLPEAWDEAVVVMDKNNGIPELMLYALGLRGDAELETMKSAMLSGGELDDKTVSYAFDELIGLEFALILPSDTYTQSGNGWTDRSDDSGYIASLYADAPKIRIVGILRPNPDAAAVSDDTFVGYTEALTEYIINAVNASDIVRAQLAEPEIDVFTGAPFGQPEVLTTMEDVRELINALPEEERSRAGDTVEMMINAGMGDEQIIAMMNASISQAASNATYDGNISILGVTDLARPSSISIYASSFENKDAVADFITEYNAAQPEGADITYTDLVGLLMSSVTTIINAISYVLIAFVSISLVVSSIMIGIITYISVLERTREIGVLRSIGASKRDISRVFNAETLIVGFTAGMLGIIVTVLLCIPANAIVNALTGIPNVAQLPIEGGIALVIISMVLTFIAGLIPSKMAARKDPVVALRTE